MDKLGPVTQSAHSILIAVYLMHLNQPINAIKPTLGQSDLFGLAATEPDEVAAAFIQAPKFTDKEWPEGGEKLGLIFNWPSNQSVPQELKNYTSGRLLIYNKLIVM